MLKVGIVGYGFMGRMHAACYQAMDDVEIAAVTERDAERRAQATQEIGCAGFDNVKAMLQGAEVDFVDVCSVTSAHEPHVLASLERGKHVICEKPMAMTLESCDRIINAARTSGAQVMIAHVLRFWPEYQAVIKLVKSGELGGVQWINARRLSSVPTWSKDNWLLDVGASGGAAFDMHIHDQDIIAALVGPPKKVLSLGTIGRLGGDSIQTLGWEHGGGAKSYAEASFAQPPGFPFQMSLMVACEKGTIRFDNTQTPSLMAYPVEAAAYAPELPPAPVLRAAEAGGNIDVLPGYFIEVRYFADCVKSGKAPEVITLQEARQAVRTCLAVRASSTTGVVVQV